ncbi:MAG: Photosynthesis system assembly factor [Frankiaceae bacterium]|jgi:hypothetical protein|nr:Photosynthesis system assembly factor [Frankiaceae bacterium]
MPAEAWALRIAPDGRHVAILAWEMTWGAPVRDGASCSVAGSASRTSVFVSADAGRTWQRTWRCPRGCLSIAWAGSNRLVAGAVDGQIYVGDDGGRRFRPGGRVFPTPLTSELSMLQAVGFADAKRGWASVNGVGIFRTDDGGYEWMPENSPQGAYQLAIGDLTVVDRERAVSGGPWVVAARMLPSTPAVVPARPALGPPSFTSDVLARVPGGYVDRSGVLHVVRRAVGGRAAR